MKKEIYGIAALLALSLGSCGTIQRTFQRIDDGVAKANEILDAGKIYMDKGAQLIELAKTKADEIDVNKDGRVGLGEFWDWLLLGLLGAGAAGGRAIIKRNQRSDDRKTGTEKAVADQKAEQAATKARVDALEKAMPAIRIIKNDQAVA